jgi:hypothetical protein
MNLLLLSGLKADNQPIETASMNIIEQHPPFIAPRSLENILCGTIQLEYPSALIFTETFGDQAA